MKNKALIFSTIFLLMAPLMPITAQDKHPLNVIQTVVPFLTIAPDSRAGAIGDVGVATSPRSLQHALEPGQICIY